MQLALALFTGADLLRKGQTLYPQWAMGVHSIFSNN
jgi:hypothetical protein